MIARLGATAGIVEWRRRADFITPIPQPRRQAGAARKDALLFDERSTRDERYHSAIINGVRAEVDKWRALSNPADWRVTPEVLEPLREKLNAALGKTWQEWEIPRDADSKWPEKARNLHAHWWQKRIARQKANDPYKALKTTLKAEIDADAWSSLNSDTSRPFDKPSTGRIAVKVINHLR